MQPEVDVTDTETGEHTRQRVLKSDPAGVKVMTRYPGLEDWITVATEAADQSGWSREKIFHEHIQGVLHPLIARPANHPS